MTEKGDQNETRGVVTLVFKAAISHFRSRLKNTARASALRASPLFSLALTRRRRSTAPWERAAGGHPAYEAIIMVQIQNGDPG